MKCFFLLLALLAISMHAQVLNSWASALSTVTMHPTFITTATQGLPITGSVIVSGNQSYTLYFYRPNQYYPTTPAFQFIQHTGSFNFTSRPVDTTGLWRIEIMPINLNQNFLILVTITTGKTSQYYVDVARRERLFIGYFQAGQNCNFSVQGIGVDQAREYQLELYEGGANLDFVRGQRLFSNAGMGNTQYDVSCTAPSTGYYYIFLSASENIMPLFTRLLVNYQSDNYPCPASTLYKDANQLFPNCVQLASNAAYPCVNFDNNLNACTQCQSSYTLEDGNCFLSVDCGLDNYFHYGNCYPAPLNCDIFSQIGGNCTKCMEGYVLAMTAQGRVCNLIPASVVTNQAITNISSSTVNEGNSYNSNANTASPASPASTVATAKNITVSQSKIINTYPTPIVTPPSKPSIVCEAGTYLYLGACALYPPHCIQYDPTKRMCTQCAQSYTVDPSNLNCILITINCPPFNSNLGNRCIPFPSHCNSTNAFGNCTSCIINYNLDANGNCIPKQCPARQYLSNNDCIAVNPNCNDYDPYQGSCLSCLFNYILASNGTCNPPIYSQLVTNGCRPRQYRVGNACNNVDPTCNLFDQYTGFCLSCIDQTQILDKSTGKCYNISEICAERYYLDPITKTCLQVSPYCDDYHPATGYCLTCTYGLTLFRGGCVVLTPCGTNQYRNQDGVCTDADPNCDGVDQATGGCIGCQPGYEINNGGICCYAQNYLLTEACKAFLSVNCISQRPYFLNCQQCAPGYSLLNGVFGKCIKKN